MTDRPAPLAPGSVIGILGGGQLGRMLALAAAELGMRCHVYCPDPQSPAFEVAAAHTVAAYEDESALAAFAAAVDVATYEFENVPAATAALLARLTLLRPGVRALEVAQDRLAEKTFVRGLGIATAPFAAVDTRADLDGAIAEIGVPAILKTRRFGYDGKGQAVIRTPGDGDAAWQAIGGTFAIIEGFIAFEREISVIAARGCDGSVEVYDPGENRHVDQILSSTVVPAPIGDAAAAGAVRIACSILDGLDYVGVIGVELFVETVGPETVLRVNEFAPRVHNSGHWTSDACVTGQFEQHIRAICGWPLGSPRRLANAVMTNLIGDEIGTWAAHAADPMSRVHVYGKTATRPGRKMGHVTRLTLGQARPGPRGE